MKRVLDNLIRPILASVFLVSPVFAADVPATLGWQERAELGLLVPGVISRVNVTEGQQVKRGDHLLSLDRRAYKAELSRAKAIAEHAKLAREEANVDLERADELYERTVISERELKLSQIEAREVIGRNAIADAELTSARINYERSVLRAPFSGVVVSVLANRGEVVLNQVQSRVLMVVADNTRMIASAKISENMARQVSVGDELTVLARDKSYQGKVVVVGVEPLETVGGNAYYSLAVSIEPGQGVLRAGESATIQLK